MLNSQSKSPLTLSILISFLVIATLVMISNYFFRPGLESNLKDRVISSIYSHNITNAVVNVEGRDVVLKGVAANQLALRRVEFEIQNISGLNDFESKLVVENGKGAIQSD